eukprot:TRINITY_DN3035_c0_g1_i1.p1 TRINITY_DN3035_c0_g1~~TRINITY_DN3035_c0_g1_i1.p1  ORF type:complete len:187 (-),score=33.15 TRINITY_DN3035_c0_g1_i1:3-515(-)
MARETKALSWLPHIHSQVGELFEELGDTVTAFKNYENAIAFHSTHSRSLTRLGAIENENGNYDMAHGYLTSSLRVDPTQHQAWFHLGLVRQHQNKDEDASEAFLTGLELETTCPVEHFFCCETIFVMDGGMSGRWIVKFEYKIVSYTDKKKSTELDVGPTRLRLPRHTRD